MPRRKRNSSALSKAERRIESLLSISTTLDFGNGLTLVAYASNIDELRSRLATYNTALSAIDKLADDLNTIEQAVLEMSEQMLMGVGSRYGRTSQEYAMAGGSRRKRSRSTAAVRLTPASPAAPASNATNGASTNGASKTAS